MTYVLKKLVQMFLTQLIYFVGHVSKEERIFQIVTNAM